MVKIKLNLFESIVSVILLPNIVIFFTTILLIISLIVKQEPIIYKCLFFSYIICFSLMILMIAICLLVNNQNKNYFILKGNEIEFLDQKYEVNQVKSCEYYACK